MHHRSGANIILRKAQTHALISLVELFFSCNFQISSSTDLDCCNFFNLEFKGTFSNFVYLLLLPFKYSTNIERAILLVEQVNSNIILSFYVFSPFIWLSSNFPSNSRCYRNHGKGETPIWMRSKEMHYLVCIKNKKLKKNN